MAEYKDKDLKGVIRYCLRNIQDSEDLECKFQKVKKYEQQTFQLPPADKLKLFNDPIHGSILLNPLEDAILNTPEFYRLREIKQLGGKSHVYPGAVHTRFEHSIGVCHLAGEFVQHLRHPHKLNKGTTAQREDESSELISDEEEYCIRIAGLCHDLGHGPFSHVFDLVTKDIQKIEPTMKRISHEKISTLMFQRILMEHPEVLHTFVSMGLRQCHVQMICEMIDCSEEFMMKIEKDKSRNKRMYLYEIVANKVSGLDVDKWDYFARDCYFLGVKNEFDYKRCMTLSRIVEYKKDGSRHIGFRDKEYQDIYGMFRTRCMIHQKACSHKKVCALEMMIKDAIVAARELKLFPNKQSLMDILTAISDGKADLSGYIRLSDNILNKIRECKLKKSKVAMSLVDRLIKRKCYTIVIYENKRLERVFPKAGNKLKKSTIKKLKKIHHLKYPDGSKEDEGYEIDCASIAYASENKHNPVRDVHFYPKQRHHSIEVVKLNKRFAPQKSQVTTPRSFMEYRVRLFKKSKQTSNGKHDKRVIEWFEKKVSWARKQARQASRKSKQAVKARGPGRRSRQSVKADRKTRQACM